MDCHTTERPHISECWDYCGACGERLENDVCVTLGCAEYEYSLVEKPYRYRVQFGGWELCYHSFTEAVQVHEASPGSRIVKYDYVPMDEDDDGLSEVERSALETPKGISRFVLVTLIDHHAEAA